MVDSTKTYVGLYAKAIAGAAVAGLGSYSAAIQDGSGVSGSEWLALAVTVLVAAGAVWAVPNIPASVASYGKAFVGAAVAVLGTLGTSWTDGSLTQIEVISAIVAGIVALGLVSATSNAAESDPVVNKKLVGVSTRSKRRLVEAPAVGPNPDIVVGEE